MNVLKLKGKIVENGLSVSKLAVELDINESTFYRKLDNGGMSFTVGELMKITDILKLNRNEFNNIFFNDFVA